MSYYKRLKKDLLLCADEGIIDRSKADEIYEKINSKKLSISASVIMFVIGGFLISLGIVLLISYNWDKIGELVKIFSYLAVFLAVGISAIKFSDLKAVSIPCETLWFFMPLIGFGLYGQVFQLSSDPLKPYMVSLFISSFLVYFLQKRYLFTIFEIFFYLLALNSSFFFHEIRDSFYTLSMKDSLTWHFAATLIFYSAGYAFAAGQQKKYYGSIQPRTYFFIAGQILGFLIASDKLFAYSVPIFITGILFLSKEKDFFSFKYFLVFLICLYVFSFDEIFSKKITSDLSSVRFIISLLIIAEATVFSGFNAFIIKNKGLAFSIIATIAFFFLSLFVNFKNMYLLVNILALFIGVFTIYASIEEERKDLINLSISFISLLIITRFIDMFNDFGFLKTGFGFIVAGIIFISGAYYVNILRKNIISKIGETNEA